MAAQPAEDPWWQLSPEEKKRIVQDAWAAALIDDLDMRDDDDAAAASYGVPAFKKAMMELYTPTWAETKTKTKEDDHHTGCAVCLEGLEIDQKLRMMPCHHTFHQVCIIKWLFVNRVCPICQFALPSDDQEQCLLDQEEEADARDAGAQGSYQPMIVE